MKTGVLEIEGAKAWAALHLRLAGLPDLGKPLLPRIIRVPVARAAMIFQSEGARRILSCAELLRLNPLQPKSL